MGQSTRQTIYIVIIISMAMISAIIKNDQYSMFAIGMIFIFGVTWAILEMNKLEKKES